MSLWWCWNFSMHSSCLGGKTWFCCQNANLRHFNALCVHCGVSAFCFFDHCLKEPPSCTNTEAAPTSARHLLLSNEACAIQQEVRRKSTKELLRTSQHGLNVKIGLHIISPWSHHGLNVKTNFSTWSPKKNSTCMFPWFTHPQLMSCVMWCRLQHDNTTIMLTLNTSTRRHVDGHLIVVLWC